MNGLSPSEIAVILGYNKDEVKKIIDKENEITYDFKTKFSKGWQKACDKITTPPPDVQWARDWEKARAKFKEVEWVKSR